MTSESLVGVDLDAPRTIVLGTGTAVVYTHRNPFGERTNQDAAAVVACAAGGDVLIVADGTGGAPGGDRAAKNAVGAVVAAVSEVDRTGLPMREGILRGFEAANQAVIAMGIGAATTLAVVDIAGNQLRAYHAGDSRILVCGQRGREKLLTTAHSPVGYAVQAGIIDEQAALKEEELHLVTNVVGNPDMHVEMSSLLTLAVRDTVVLGSDGLFDNLAPGEVADLLRAGDLHAAVKRAVGLVRVRMDTEGERHPSKPDDLTVVAYRPRPPPRQGRRRAT
jgi:serine/threonine protein phosphatase PrpC